MEKIYVRNGETKETFWMTKSELVKYCNENNLCVVRLVCNYISESLEYSEIEWFLDHKFKQGYEVRLCSKANKRFYCKGYNS